MMTIIQDDSHGNDRNGRRDQITALTPEPASEKEVVMMWLNYIFNTLTKLKRKFVHNITETDITKRTIYLSNTLRQ